MPLQTLEDSPPELDKLWQTLEAVVDPEIPVLTIADLGLLRDAEIGADETVTVTITPTYSGCPAMNMIEQEIKRVLGEAGYGAVEVKTVLHPAWTTDWLSESGARETARLRHRAAGQGLDQQAGALRRGAGSDLSPLRLQGDGAGQRLRLHRVQGALALPKLPGALRLLQVHLSRERKAPCIRDSTA